MIVPPACYAYLYFGASWSIRDFCSASLTCRDVGLRAQSSSACVADVIRSEGRRRYVVTRLAARSNAQDSLTTVDGSFDYVSFAASEPGFNTPCSSVSTPLPNSSDTGPL